MFFGLDFCCGLLKCVSSRFFLEPPGLKNPQKVDELVVESTHLNNMLVKLDHSPNFWGENTKKKSWKAPIKKLWYNFSPPLLGKVKL